MKRTVATLLFVSSLTACNGVPLEKTADGSSESDPRSKDAVGAKEAPGAATTAKVAAAQRQIVTAGDWPQWRGPSFDGSAEAKNLPVKFGIDENVKWAASLPGPAGSTPIVVGDRVFLSSFDRETQMVVALCLDRHKGTEIWRRGLGKGRESKRQGTENFMAAPSPVTDGEIVYFLTGRGDLIAFDVVGDEKWRWNVQEKYGGFNYMWGYGASPLLYEKRLFVQVLHRDTRYDEDSEFKLEPESYFLAVDPKTGEVLYRHVRATDAVGETKESYATPIPAAVDGRQAIVILGADYVTGHDPATGEELWRFGGWNPKKITHWRMVTSPAIGGGLVYASCPKAGPIDAVKVDGGEASLSWRMPAGETTDVPTPLYYKGRLYVLNGKKRVITALDPATGKQFWQGKLPGDRYMRASLTAADGKIYCMNADGDVTVVGTGDEFEILHNTSFGGYPARSSIVIAHDHLFIRTAEKLYCIGS